ncbi:hypothetical protein H5410_052091 [Solanum commersonii]|uniref:Uncharacterized protein n=1 Tax=Solanum commersonii TaxID=4109 RepID=A0A9J5X308_SOLCO|nr:hypothetical protein H5410_052091 [Solanum commersonii]
MMPPEPKWGALEEIKVSVTLLQLWKTQIITVQITCILYRNLSMKSPLGHLGADINIIPGASNNSC